MRRLFSRFWSLISPSFGVLGSLCFLAVFTYICSVCIPVQLSPFRKGVCSNRKTNTSRFGTPESVSIYKPI